MYSQNCNFLPNKKQSVLSLNSSLPHNTVNKNCFSFNKPFNSSGFSPKEHSEQTQQDSQQLRRDIISPMDFLYSLNNSPEIKLDDSMAGKKVAPEKLKQNCKPLFSQYTPVSPTIPLLSQHLIGGFVGSKTQLGRSPVHGLGIKMCDIIGDVAEVFEVSSSKIVKKGNIIESSLIGKSLCSMVKVDTSSQELLSEMGKPSGNSNKQHNGSPKLQECYNQSYADVIKTNSDLPLKTKDSSDKEKNKNQETSSADECESSSEEDTLSEIENKSRTSSECTIESDDSFIVFGYCEEDDDFSIIDDCSTSDDESLDDFEAINKESCREYESSLPQETSIKREEYCVVNESEPTRKKASEKKQVQFAEDKNLVKTHKIVAWDFAYRAARKGPWEMYARDAARFKARIIEKGSIIAPILNPEHREAIYQQRFEHVSY